MPIESEFQREPPPWAAAVERDGIMTPSEAAEILAVLGERTKIPDGSLRMSWEDQERLIRARIRMTWSDVNRQFPFDYSALPWRKHSSEGQRIFPEGVWIGEDLEVVTQVEIPPGGLKPTIIPVTLRQNNLPMNLDRFGSQIVNDFGGILHLGTRSRYAQAGIEVVGCKVDLEDYQKLQKGEEVGTLAYGFNYGYQPFLLEAGTHPCGHFSFEGTPRLVGYELVEKKNQGDIEVEGKIGEDWDWIFHPSWPANYLHIVGMRVRIGNWQMLRQEESANAITISDRGGGYRQEIAQLYEPADFERLLPGVRVQHGPFMMIEEYRGYLERLAARDVRSPVGKVFLMAETPYMALNNGIAAVVGKYPNTYAYQLNAVKIEGTTADGVARTAWPVRTEIVSAVLRGVCVLPSFINFYFFQG